MQRTNVVPVTGLLLAATLGGASSVVQGCAGAATPRAAASPHAAQQANSNAAIVSEAQSKVPDSSRTSSTSTAALGTRPQWAALSESLRRFAPGKAPACTVSWANDGGQPALLVGGARVTPPDELISYGTELPPNQLRYNDDAILLSYGQHRFAGAANPQLWLLECSGQHRLVLAHSSEPSNFSWVLTSSDGRWLFHAGEQGLRALDLATLNSPTPRSLVVANSVPEYRPMCWTGSVIMPNYLPVSWREPGRSMSVRSEGACGFEGDPESWLARISDISLEKPTAKVELLSPISTVRVDDRATLWVGDGERCDGTDLHAPSSRGALWRSKDAGKSWSPVELFNGTFAPNEGVVQLEVQGASMVALTSRCVDHIAGGGDVWWSRDHGQTWRMVIANQEVIPSTEETQGLLFEQIQLLKVDPLRVRAFRGQEVWEATIDPKAVQDFQAAPPTGGPWERRKSVPRPVRTDTTAKVGSVTFSTTERGLERSDTKQLTFSTLDYLRAFHFHSWQEDVATEAPLVVPVRTPPAEQPWLSGCRSLGQLPTPSDWLETLQFAGTLTIVGVTPADTVNVRALPGTGSHVLSGLKLLQADLTAMGSVCRTDGQDWVQVNTPSGMGWVNSRYLKHVSAPQQNELAMRLVEGESGTPEELTVTLQVELATATGSSIVVQPLGIASDQHSARSVLQLKSGTPNAKEELLEVEFSRRDSTWRAVSCKLYEVCSRGLTSDRRCE